VIACINCGQLNENAARNCIRCGSTAFQLPSEPGGILPSGESPSPFSYAPPPPRPDFFAGPPPAPVIIAGMPPPMMGGVCCPYCRTTYPPIIRRQISTAGWITFAVLLVFCWPLFWIGLLIREDIRICSACGARLP
jgi:ribosomal protein L40E